MSRFLRISLGLLLLLATIGMVTCQSLLNAEPAINDSASQSIRDLR